MDSLAEHEEEAVRWEGHLLRFVIPGLGREPAAFSLRSRLRWGRVKGRGHDQEGAQVGVEVEGGGGRLLVALRCRGALFGLQR